MQRNSDPVQRWPVHRTVYHQQDVVIAFGSNFLGSVLGGVLEYGSLAFGISSLYLFGTVLYALAWLVRPRAAGA